MTNTVFARLTTISILSASLLLTPSESHACACGCGVFDVGTSSMLPTHEGGMAWFEYDFMDQNQNWHHSSGAPSANNDDKNLKSSFFNAGAEYMFNRSWGAEIEIPYTSRHFTTTDGNTGNINSFDHSAIGDIHLQAVYSGFSPDMSSGITFGVRLPTGDYNYVNFDRDTAIGSGSTDILLGAYHMGNLTNKFNWFANGQLDQPVLITAGYRPGSEVDAAAGVYYNGWTIDAVKIAPLVQLTNSYRLQDRGIAANPDGSGYERILLSPGVEIDTAGYRLYSDVGVPVYQFVKGNQLVAGLFFKLNISRSF